MADYEDRYEPNGGAYEEDGGHGDHKSKYDSREHERGSSKSRDREREREKEKRRDRDRERSKDRDRDRERERDRHHDHHHRDHKERSERRGHGHDKYDDYDHHHSRDHDRGKDYDVDRDGHHRHRSRSGSRARSHHKSRSRSRSRARSHHRSRSCSHSRARSGHRSRSRSRSRSKSKRISGFDMPPPTAVVAGAAAAGQMTGIPAAIPGVLPNMLPLAAGQPAALSLMPFQAMTQQATRHARRIYVGGLPPTANEQSVSTYFNQVMATIGGNTAGPGDAVVNVYINHEKKFAFVEMRSVEEASNAMALDGIIFEGAPVKVRRPSDYNPSIAAALGPSQPNPNLNLAAVGLKPGSAGASGLEGPDRIFVGGLPYFLTEEKVQELLVTFGPLRGFDLVKDRETGNSKGYAFCVYQDPSVTDIACAALNGIKMGDNKTLTVRRANQGATQLRPDQESVILQAQQQVAFQKLVYQAGSLPTKVVCLTQVVTADDLKDDEEYEDIMEDMRGEGGKYGNLVNVVIPRPGPNGELSSGVGKVFLEYADTDGSVKARQGMNGRKFGGKQVVAVFYPENKFAQGEYDG